jgi:radical SAM superfamily enzyme YgiQ (UPF0313 family)
MRVLLLNPPYIPNFIRSARSTWPSISGSNWYPIFLGYATGWLEKHGHKCKLVDAPVAGLTHAETVQLAKEFKPDLAVIYTSALSLENDYEIAVKIKQQTQAQIVFVGPWCGYKPEVIMADHPQIDVIIPREFEDVLLDMAEGKKLKIIKGLIFRKGEAIVRNPERPFIDTKILDEMPFVTSVYKKHLPIDKYYQASLLHPFVDFFTARGCIWGKCTFCLWPNTIQQGALYRQRSIDSVTTEIQYVKNRFGSVKEIFFQDDTLATGRAREISRFLIDKNIKLNWSCYLRANVDFETLDLMKKSGCRFVHVGYESGNQNILNTMNKGTKLADMEKFTRDTKKAGIRVHGDFIVGLPGETEKTVNETVKWAKSLDIEGYQFFIPQPQPGTPLYAYALQNKLLTQDGMLSYPAMSAAKMNQLRFQAMRSIYLTPKYIVNTIRNIDSLDEFARLMRTAMHVLPSIISN